MSFLPFQKTAGDSKSFLQTILWAAGAIFLAGMIAMVVSGWYARYLQDDYCFDFLLKHRGFWNAQVFTFFNEVTFNGNRFAANLVMGVLAQIGPFSARLIPGFQLLAWLASAWWLLRGLNWLLKWHKPGAFLFFLAASVVFFSLVQAPNQFQILYWRPASVTYLMPLVLLTFSFALILHYIENNQTSFGYLLIIGILAFLVGGFSETATAFQIGLFVFLLLWINFKKPFDFLLLKITNRLGLATLIGSILAVIVLILAPSAHLRQAALFPQPPQMIEMLRIALNAIRQFLLLTVYRQTLISLLGFLVFFYLGFVFSQYSRNSFTERKSRLWLKYIFGRYRILFSTLLYHPAQCFCLFVHSGRAGVALGALYLGSLTDSYFHSAGGLGGTSPIQFAQPAFPDCFWIFFGICQCSFNSCCPCKNTLSTRLSGNTGLAVSKSVFDWFIGGSFHPSAFDCQSGENRKQIH